MENQASIKRIYKYETDEQRHEASKASKRHWYHINRDVQKLKSLKAYYIKQLQKTDLKEEVKAKYESKLKAIEDKL